ncbi:MAG: hypothetical protein ACJ74C_02705, partial [Gaiellaceae bacterium]
VPENLPSPLYARKVQRRAASSGFDPLGAEEALQALRATIDEADRDGSLESVGDLLFAAVNVARRLGADPELELRRASQRFVFRVEEAERLAGAEGQAFAELALRAMSRRFVERVERAEVRASAEGKSFVDLEVVEQDHYVDLAQEDVR